VTSQFLRLATAILCLAFWGEGLPQAYPSKTISMVVPLGPGSQADNVARVLAERLQGNGRRRYGRFPKRKAALPRSPVKRS